MTDQVEQTTNEETGVETLEARIDRLYRELARSIKFDKAAILLAVYRSEFVRAAVEKRLAARLEEAGQQVVRLFINEQYPDLPAYLRERADERHTVFFVSGLRFGGGEDGRAAYRALNIRREYFIDYRLRVVFWITEDEERNLPRYAPDFWAFRHRVIPFLDEPAPEQMEQHAYDLTWREWQGRMASDDPAFTQNTAAKIAYRERLLAELPETPQMHRARRDLLHTLIPLHNTQKNHNHALTLCEHILVLDPEDAGAYNSRGLTYSKMGKHEAALVDYSRAIALNPEYAIAFYNRGNTYDEIGKYEAALADYNRAIALNPEDAAAFYNRGNIYDKIREYKAALADYDRAIALNPEDATYNNRGNTYHDLEQYKAALADYDSAIALNPEYAAAYNNRGATYHKMKQYETALADYNRAIALNPGDAAAYNNRGTTYDKMGNYEAALADYSQAIALNPNYADAYYGRGLTYGKKGNYKAATSDYEHAVSINPNHRVAQMALAGAYRHLGRQEAYEAQVAKARPLLAELSPYNRACFAAICDEVDEAVELLAQALEEDPSMKEWARQDPDFAFIRHVPRYRALVGLEETANEKSR
jgi:tetratricopeptide (TPR) repeat protein